MLLARREDVSAVRACVCPWQMQLATTQRKDCQENSQYAKGTCTKSQDLCALSLSPSPTGPKWRPHLEGHIEAGNVSVTHLGQLLDEFQHEGLMMQTEEVLNLGVRFQWNILISQKNDSSLECNPMTSTWLWPSLCARAHTHAHTHKLHVSTG